MLRLQYCQQKYRCRHFGLELLYTQKRRAEIQRALICQSNQPNNMLLELYVNSPDSGKPYI